jgi:hypothetical protein
VHALLSAVRGFSGICAFSAGCFHEIAPTLYGCYLPNSDSYTSFAIGFRDGPFSTALALESPSRPAGAAGRDDRLQCGSGLAQGRMNDA